MTKTIEETVGRLEVVEAMLRQALVNHPIWHVRNCRSALLALRDVADDLRTESIRQRALAAQDTGEPQPLVGRLDKPGLSWSDDTPDRKQSRLHVIRSSRLQASSVG